MKYLYDIVAMLGLIMVAVGVGLEYGYTFGLILAGAVLLVLAVYLSVKVNASS